MSKANYLIVLLFAALNLFSQTESLNQGKLNQKNYYEEIDFVVEHDKIILPVYIDGKSYRFLLDTGAPNLISKKVLADLNIVNTNAIQAQDANNQKSAIETASVPSIKIGKLALENSPVLVSDLDNHFVLKCYRYDGFIGSNFFQNSVLKISLKDKKITVTDDVKRLQLQSKPTKLKLVGQQKAPYIQISFSKKTTEDVLVDTGMDGFYEISNRAYAIFTKEVVFEKLSESSGSASVGLFGAAPLKQQALLRFKEIKINDAKFKNLITNTTDDNNSRLGMDLLQYGDIIIDFKNKKFYFEADKTVVFDEKPPVYSSTLIDNKLAIGFVWDDAYRNRLHYGDEILKIGPHRLADMDYCDMIMLKNYRKNNPSHDIEIKNADQQNVLIKIEN